MKKIISLFLVLAMTISLAVSFTSCGDKTDLEKVKESGKLVIGVTQYYPMDYIGDDGETWEGFDAEVAELVAKDLGVEAQFILIKWANKVTELKSGNIDVIWNGMTASSELGEQIDLSVSYAENKQVAVINKKNESTIDSIEAIKNSKVSVEQGSAGASVAKDTIGASSVIEVDGQTKALLEVKAGTSDVCIIDYTMAYGLVGKGDYTDLIIVDTDKVSFEREEFAVGTRKGSDLTDKINELLKKYYEDGTLAEIAAKYNGAVALNEEALSK
jgi:polar amino acid transport system substrate-binding protein